VPPGARGREDLEPTDEETLDHVCGHWRIFQRRDGHRFSTDDFVCAWYAVDRVRAAGLAPREVLDLGTGIASVALMVGWQLPDARVTGIEVQPVSAALARRSVAYNGVEDRFRIVDGDLRDASRVGDGRSFDLVTGSPPYLPRGSGLESGRPQRAPARFDHHGGVDGYALAAARCLGPRGLFALVYAAYRPDDVPAAARGAGLSLRSRRLVIPKTGKDPLLELFVLSSPDWDPGLVPEEPALTVRGVDDRWTEEYQTIRTAMGFPSPRPR